MNSKVEHGSMEELMEVRYFTAGLQRHQNGCGRDLIGSGRGLPFVGRGLLQEKYLLLAVRMTLCPTSSPEGRTAAVRSAARMRFLSTSSINSRRAR
ncbi:hypothetical protein AGOR_G00043910 [Albula goreensis]|uniref:Uncharacterized protein n=1 Tax=Albula goreensis TaxID=1534307 RepID=A0A8T3E317_9TELE|nr:hypothetical protein AGOR_G00043910 [Albula goreensis]